MGKTISFKIKLKDYYEFDHKFLKNHQGQSIEEFMQELMLPDDIYPAINPTPVTVAPTASGNTENLNSFVSFEGDVYFIDASGNSVLFTASLPDDIRPAINPVPVTAAPPASGNTANLNSFVSFDGDVYFIASSGISVRFPSFTDFVPTPVAAEPTASGNTENLNSFVIFSGIVFFIDADGEAVEIQNNPLLANLQTSVTANQSAITTNQSGIANLQTSVTANQSAITTNQTDIANLQTSVTANQSAITTNQSDIANLQTSVTANQSAITTNQTDIANLQTSVTANQSAITTNQSGIANLQTSVTANQSAITTNQSDIANLQTSVTANQSAITTNQTDITTNQTDIATNQTDITNIQNQISALQSVDVSALQMQVDQNSAGIATNTSAIAGNTSSIATNTGAIATNVTAIAGNTSSIATNTGAIATNTSAIAGNTSSIATNTGAIATNVTAIAGNTSSIATNTGAIATNVTAIAGNTSSITTNTGAIATNTSAIAGNTSSIATNTGAIATNTSAIAGNTSLIATNTGAIATNTSAIAALQAKRHLESDNLTLESNRTINGDNNSLLLNQLNSFNSGHANLLFSSQNFPVVSQFQQTPQSVSMLSQNGPDSARVSVNSQKVLIKTTDDSIFGDVLTAALNPVSGEVFYQRPIYQIMSEVMSGGVNPGELQTAENVYFQIFDIAGITTGDSIAPVGTATIMINHFGYVRSGNSQRVNLPYMKGPDTVFPNAAANGRIEMIVDGFTIDEGWIAIVYMK